MLYFVTLFKSSKDMSHQMLVHPAVRRSKKLLRLSLRIDRLPSICQLALMSSKHTKYQTSFRDKKTSVGLNCPPCILSANQAVAFLFAPCADLSLDVTDLQRLQSSLNYKKLLLFDIGERTPKTFP